MGILPGKLQGGWATASEARQEPIPDRLRLVGRGDIDHFCQSGGGLRVESSGPSGAVPTPTSLAIGHPRREQHQRQCSGQQQHPVEPPHYPSHRTSGVERAELGRSVDLPAFGHEIQKPGHSALELLGKRQLSLPVLLDGLPITDAVLSGDGDHRGQDRSGEDRGPIAYLVQSHQAHGNRPQHDTHQQGEEQKGGEILLGAHRYPGDQEPLNQARRQPEGEAHPSELCRLGGANGTRVVALVNLHTPMLAKFAPDSDRGKHKAATGGRAEGSQESASFLP